MKIHRFMFCIILVVPSAASYCSYCCMFLWLFICVCNDLCLGKINRIYNTKEKQKQTKKKKLKQIQINVFTVIVVVFVIIVKL